MYPARRDAKLPEVFRFAPEPIGSARLDPGVMAKNRERWIEEWTKVVLQGQSPEAVRRARR
jgi:thiamine transport system substrate-binding protein